jgi:chitodextrinase
VTAAGSYSADAPLSAGGPWIMQMVAFRAAASSSTGDTQPPTAPTGVTAIAASGTTVNLSWTASTDNTGVASYLIDRCQGAGCATFTQTGTAATTTYSVTGLSASTSYSFRVRATDAAGNMSSYSTVVTATTPASSDTQPPTTPANVTGTAVSTTQINLTWTASSDNTGVTGYIVERCQAAGCSTFAQVATPTAAGFSDTTGLVASTSYSYRVRAKDAAGNLSAYSTVASATTSAATSTAPTQVVFTASADDSTTLVTGYRLEVFAAGANPSTATPVATSDLGKPTPATTNDITVDRATFFSGLAAGNYVATVSAYGSGGTSRSTSVTFTR